MPGSTVVGSDDGEGKGHGMHPTLMHEVARYRQADMLREAERARLAQEASAEVTRTRRRWPRRRERPVFKPAFER